MWFYCDYGMDMYVCVMRHDFKRNAYYPDVKADNLHIDSTRSLMQWNEWMVHLQSNVNNVHFSWSLIIGIAFPIQKILLVIISTTPIMYFNLHVSYIGLLCC